MDTAITTRDPFADLRGLTVEALEQESTRLHETIADWTDGDGEPAAIQLDRRPGQRGQLPYRRPRSCVTLRTIGICPIRALTRFTPPLPEFSTPRSAGRSPNSTWSSRWTSLRTVECASAFC